MAFRFPSHYISGNTFVWVGYETAAPRYNQPFTEYLRMESEDGSRRVSDIVEVITAVWTGERNVLCQDHNGWDIYEYHCEITERRAP